MFFEWKRQEGCFTQALSSADTGRSPPLEFSLILPTLVSGTQTNGTLCCIEMGSKVSFPLPHLLKISRAFSHQLVARLHQGELSARTRQNISSGKKTFFFPTQFKFHLCTANMNSQSVGIGVNDADVAFCRFKSVRFVIPKVM